MNRFLERLYEKPQLKELKDWGDEFWKSYAEKKVENFAQQGYEDKGCGHIERIISNVGELLENYCQILYKLNHTKDDSNPIFNSGKKFEEYFIDHLEPNLVMFYTATILHDIGMNFPGIFKALKKVIDTVGESALHIGEIIHNYHHYSSFIILLEIKHIADLEKKLKMTDRFLDKIKKNITNDKKVEEIIKENEDKISKKCPFLANIPVNVKTQSIRVLLELYIHLQGIYIEYFSRPGKNGFKEKEFFVILAILCLLHKEVNPENIQSILRKFRPHHEETVHDFNKWWDFFNRAREWTETAPQWLPGILGTGEKDIFPGLITLKKFPGKKLNLLLVEALLQYGDKTEITIARLARNPKACGEKIQGARIPLEDFMDDIEWDNKKGFICTNMAKRIISDFARFRACRFIPIFLVKVEHDSEVYPRRLDVIMHYFRFANDEDVFQVLRYHNEKDFYDLKFLEVIRIHIPILLCYFEEKNKLKPIKGKEERQGPKENPLLEIKFRKMEHQFPNLINELKKLITDSSGIIENGRSNLATIRSKLSEYQSGNSHDEFNALINDLVEDLENQKLNRKGSKKVTSNRLLRLSYTLKKQLIAFLESYISTTQEKKETNHPTEDRIYGLEKKLEGMLSDFPDTSKGLKVLQDTIEDTDDIIPLENLFPYTPQNKEAIFKFSQSILNPEIKNKAIGRKKVFYESCDLIVPSSFELVAILNLFLEEE